MKRTRGFTMLEVIIVLVIASVLMVVAGLSFGRYRERTSAKRAAELFGQDLTVARNTAYRSRQTVVMDFAESSLNYVIRVAAGDTLFSRSFGDDQDLELTGLDLELSGDTVAFDSRGVADLGGATLGRAVFTVGSTAYGVTFNALGVSRVQEET